MKAISGGKMARMAPDLISFCFLAGAEYAFNDALHPVSVPLCKCPPLISYIPHTPKKFILLSVLEMLVSVFE
ncbi:hypothetical protein XELAEV_18002849mg [Xenopus laevis]|nr:hypothetical protein XELAEV_18002849mg [Xenopus laevis]